MLKGELIQKASGQRLSGHLRQANTTETSMHGGLNREALVVEVLSVFSGSEGIHVNWLAAIQTSCKKRPWFLSGIAISSDERISALTDYRGLSTWAEADDETSDNAGCMSG
jgi:hypothetical protein